MEGSCENGNEPSGSAKAGERSAYTALKLGLLIFLYSTVCTFSNYVHL